MDGEETKRLGRDSVFRLEMRISCYGGSLWRRLG